MKFDAKIGTINERTYKRTEQLASRDGCNNYAAVREDKASN